MDAPLNTGFAELGAPKFRLTTDQVVEIDDERCLFSRALPFADEARADLKTTFRYLFQRERDGAALLLTEAHIEGLVSRRKFRPISKARASRTITFDPPEARGWRARHRAFWCREYDRSPVPFSKSALTKFRERVLKENVENSQAQPLLATWKPAIWTLRQWFKTRGSIDSRPLSLMDDQRGTWSRTFGADTERAMRTALAWYWSERCYTKSDAYDRLQSALRKRNQRAARGGGYANAVRIPSRQTFFRRIAETENIETWRAKYGELAARRRFGGVRPGITATRPMECVIIDSTVVDTHLVLDSDSLIPLGRPTLTVAIDVCTRCIVGLVLTFEHPSLYTIMAVLKDVLLPKLNRIEAYKDWIPDLHVTLAPFGKPATIVVDNAWENVGKSVQDACTDIGINVHWAPAECPEAKAIGERAFQTLNMQVFHKAPGAVAYAAHILRKLGIDPAATAQMTANELEAALIAWLDTYHRDEHDRIGMPPIVAWRHGIASHGIDVVPDPDFLDQAIGEVSTVSITREGVTLEGVRYHDPYETTYLLESLGRFRDGHLRRKHSAIAKAKAKRNPANPRELHVWCEPDARYVSLPAINGSYLFGLTRAQAKMVREFAREEGLPFTSDEERLKARRRLVRTLERAMGPERLKARQKQRQLLSPATLSAVGAGIRVKHVPPRHDGAEGLEIPVATGLRQGAAMPPRGPRRGGKRAQTSKAERPNTAAGAPPPDAARSEPPLSWPPFKRGPALDGDDAPASADPASTRPSAPDTPANDTRDTGASASETDAVLAEWMARGWGQRSSSPRDSTSAGASVAGSEAIAEVHPKARRRRRTDD